MNKKLILTGVTGQKSGSVLVEHIANNLEKIKEMFPDGIRVICRESSNIEKINRLLLEAEIKRGSFLNKEFLVEALQDADTVIHVAWTKFSKDIADAAAQNHVRRIISVHTTGIYSKYKAAGEEYRKIDAYVEKICNDNGILLTILRPTMIYGNIYDQNVVKFIKMVDKLPVMPIVKGARYELQPVHYKDLGKAYFDVLMNEKATANHNYNLSGGEVIQLRDMLTVIGDNLDKKIKFISFPFWFAYSGAWILFLLTFGNFDYREKVQRLCEPRVYSHEDATRDFGYNPQTFRKGIVAEIREYKENSR